ncbi:CHAT domain-containing protein [Rhizobium leguminosarum]|uniref:CHAT domain-containing protein n=1 Tax=Rhizobium leguminosarum TaxID=384 RepID=UPI0013DC17CC|nr:CHAT domain-containing protein [Rhizobium leguminosarum]NEH49581.1 CHAT domain-containing protein [Rhizobium leguminosarum]
MSNSVKEVIEEFFTSDRSQDAFAEAMGKAAAMGSVRPSPMLQDELVTLLRELESVCGSRPDFDLIASMICWQVAEGGPVKIDGCGLTDARLKGKIAFSLARSMLFEGNTEGAAHFVNIAGEHFASVGAREHEAQLLGLRASVALQQNEPKKALIVYRQALTAALERDDGITVAHSRQGIGLALLRIGGKEQEARAELISAADKFRAYLDVHGEFGSLVLVSQTMDDVGETEAKAGYLMRALALGSHATIAPSRLFPVFAKLATLHMRLGEESQAEDILDRGLRLALDAGERYFEGFFALNLGGLLATNARGPEARRLFQQALNACRSVGDQEGVQLASRNLELLNAGNIAKDSKPIIHKAGTPIEPTTQAAAPEVDSILETLKAAAERARAGMNAGQPMLHLIPADPAPSQATIEAVYQAASASERELSERDPTSGFLLFLVLSKWLPQTTISETRLFTLNKLGILALGVNQLEVAVGAFSEAAAIDPDQPPNKGKISVLVNLGSALRRAGQTERARETYDEAVRIVADFSDPIMRANVFINAATAYGDLLMKDKMVELSMAAIELLKDAPDQKEALLIAKINHAGGISWQENPEEAMGLYGEALDLARHLGNEQQVFVCLGHLGLIKFGQGQISESVDLLGSAAGGAESIKDFWNAQHWHFDLGNVYLWIDSSKRARIHFERSRALSEQIGDERSAVRAILGMAKASGEDEALALLDDGWKRSIASGNVGLAIQVAEAQIEALVHRAFGLAEWKPNFSLEISPKRGPDRLKNPVALAAARAAFQRGQQLLSEIHDADLVVQFARSEAGILRLEGRSNDAVSLLERIIEKTKNPLALARCHANLGSVYLQDLSLPDRALPHLEHAWEKLRLEGELLPNAEMRLDHRQMSTACSNLLIQCALCLDKLEIAFRVCEASKMVELGRLWLLRHGSAISIPTTGDLSALFEGSSTVLVQFLPPADRMHIVIIGSGSKPAVQLAVDVAATQIGRWGWRILKAYDTTTAVNGIPDRTSKQIWRDELSAVCSEIGLRLIKPICDAISTNWPDTDSVILVPCSILHALPLHACSMGPGCLLDRYDVSYAPSSALVANLWRRPDWQMGSFVGIADPEGDLPMARAEVRTASGMFEQANVLEGQAASKGSALTLMQDVDWLHFACHARLVLGNPQATGIRLAAQVDDRDHILSLDEITRSGRIKQNAVVVLSACETGSSMPYFADEYVSIAGGVVTAGAQAVVATMWKVRDACAALVMSRFYREIAGGEADLSRALGCAVCHVRELNEQETFSELSQLIGTPASHPENIGSLLAEFAFKREHYLPFAHVSDWGSFQLVGLGARVVAGRVQKSSNPGLSAKKFTH